MDYGVIDTATADSLIEKLPDEMAAEARNDLIRRAIEHIHLDFPVMVASYAKRYWPADTQQFGGYLKRIPAPGSTYLSSQLVQLYRT